MTQNQWFTNRGFCETFAISRSTLYRWCRSGRVECVHPVNGSHRRYRIGKRDDTQTESTQTIDVIYARVSTMKQRPYLETQVQFMCDTYPNHLVITDIASGLNFKRKGLQKVMRLMLERKLRIICVSHRDRLCRFAFDLIHWLFCHFGVTLVIHEAGIGGQNNNPEAELAEDILSILTVFGARLYGARSGQSRRKKETLINTSCLSPIALGSNHRNPMR